MKKLVLTVKENWKDPVWSKVIAVIIIALGSFLLTTLYSFVKSLISNVSFGSVLNEVYMFFLNDVKIKLWVVIILVFAYFILIFKPIIVLIEQIITKFRKPRKKGNEFTKELPRATEYSTSFFSYRMASAFPGIRGIKWFDNPKIAMKRLAILLKEPLTFSSGSKETESDPIWWFRGVRALCIEKFKKIGSRKVLMNIDQLKINRIAAYRGDSYYKDFVYVEVEGESQSGLYKYTKDEIQRHIEHFGYSWEEYGLIKNKLGWTIPIRREDYDDGATIIRGEVRDALGAELRVRYLSTYNFIIAAKGSPYNSRKFEQESKTYLNGILKGEIEPNDFFGFLKEFQKYEQ